MSTPHVDAAAGAEPAALTLAETVARLAEAEDTLRAIGAGEVDAFVVSDGGTGRHVFTLSTADRTYRRFVESMRDGAATISSSGLILFANQRLAALLSSSVETLVGSPLAMFVAGGVPEWDMTHGPGGLGATVELDLVDSSGATVPVLAGASPLEVDGDDLTCVTFADLSVQKAQEREIARSEAQAERMVELQDAETALTEQATHDALTGLPNRGLLFDRTNQALFHAKRTGLCTALLFVDLDEFKQVNDTRGHAAGDAVLQTVANRLAALLRPMDTVARIGGDEFVVLAPDIASELDAIHLSERIITELFRRPDRTADDDRFAASIGITVSGGGRGTADILLHEADTAMYQAKALGGGRAEVFDAALGRQIRERSGAQRMLQTALDESRISVHYQPILDLATGSVAGFEALARMTGRDGSIELPAAFIPVAEDSGLVVQLGAQVLAIACQQACGWPATGRGGHALTAAVNVSPRQFASGDLTVLLRDTLEQTGLDPARLHLELTETAIVGLQPDVLEQLALIADLGVQIGLDDFGTGTASLTHLRRLPLTFVKLDQTFIAEIGTGTSEEGVVSAVVDLAANLGLRSIAEGVETSAQLARLRSLGCDQAQGYLFARPMPPGDVPAALARPAW